MGNLVFGGQQHQIHSDLDINALLYEDRDSAHRSASKAKGRGRNPDPTSFPRIHYEWR